MNVIDSITPAQEAELAGVAQKWIGHAFRTEPIQHDKIVPAIRDLYEVAKLAPPRVVLVASPKLMVYAHATATQILSKYRLPDAKPEQTKFTKVHKTVASAVVETIQGLVPDEVVELVMAYTETDHRQACKLIAGDEALSEAKQWSNHTQGGNTNAAWAGYISAYRDVLHLDIPEMKLFAPYEQAAIEGSYRMMHEDFCLVSDFPSAIRTHDNKAHNESGATHEWRDGWKLYHWHGVHVPAEWIENKASLTAKEVIKSKYDTRTGLEIINWEGVFNGKNSKLLDDDAEYGQLWKVKTLKDVTMSTLFLRKDNRWIEVPEHITTTEGREVSTAFEAVSGMALAKLTTGDNDE